MTFRPFAASLDAELRSMIDHFASPGGLAVVVKGDDSHGMTWGPKRIGAPEPIGPHTAFSIASCSKAFCATAAAVLADDGKLKWSEPVVETVPEYAVADPWISRNTMVSDLLGMRTGLKREGISEFGMGSPSSCVDLLPRLKGITQEFGLRERFTYMNAGYGVMAALIERKAGMPYADFLKERIFTPLDMADAVSCRNVLGAHHDHFIPHIRLNGEISALPEARCLGFEGSSCVYLSAADAIQWLRFQIAESGELDGKKVLSKDALMATHTQRSIDNPVPQTGESFAIYCMGWQAFDFHGRRFYRHTGSEVGASTMILFCPEEKLGVAVFFNIYCNGFMALAYHMLERFMDVPPGPWVEKIAAAFKTRVDGELKTLEEKFAIAGAPSTSAELDSYVGHYRNPIQSDLTLSRHGDRLKLHLVDCPLLDAELEPAGTDVFFLHQGYVGMEQDLLGVKKRVRFHQKDGAMTLSHSLLGDFTRVVEKS